MPADKPALFVETSFRGSSDAPDFLAQAVVLDEHKRGWHSVQR
ncbi:hypothetical protein ACL02S_16460 [Nocardia sp. 004]